MKVIFFTRDYTTHDRRFLIKLAQSHHEIFFLRLEDDGILYEEKSLPDNIQAIVWQGGKQPAKNYTDWLTLMPDFEGVLNKIQPDLIHAGPVQSCGFMTALAQFHPFLLMSWGSDILVDAHKDEFWGWMTRYTLRHSDFLVCDSESVKQRVHELVVYPEEHIIKFPWGIDLEKFTPVSSISPLREKLNWQNKFVLLSTRTWEKIYGIDVLLEAFHKAYMVNNNLRLMLMGDGSLAGWINSFIKQNRLEQAIHIVGQVDNDRISDYYQSSDTYISCAYSDGTSISLLEALAMGLPVIVTDIPSNREWIVPKQNGWLGKAGDMNSFKEAILECFSMDQSEIHHIKQDNRKVALKHANWNNNIEKLLKLYKEIEDKHLI